MKKTKIVVPALAVLLLSTAASVSGTVAWFSMNATVNVTGMTVTTKVSSNLQIAEHNNETQYTDALTQSRSGVLEPASSVDGVAFFHTVRASGAGVAKPDGANTYKTYNENESLSNVGAGKTAYDAVFNTDYGFATPITDSNVCYGYIDYSFYLKGGYSDNAHRISMTKCEIAYNNGGNVDTARAWRVGMFVQKANTLNADVSTAVADTDLVTILDFGDYSKNQNEVEAVTFTENYTIPASTFYANANLTGDALEAGTASAAQVGKTFYKASSATGPMAVNGNSNTSLAAVENDGEEAIVDDNISINTTQRYKVTVRLWLEGEDVSCTSTTFANLTSAWTLDLQFGLGTTTQYVPVEEISAPAAQQQQNP